MGRLRRWLAHGDLEGDRSVVAAALLFLVVMIGFKLALLTWLLDNGQQPLPRALPFAALLFGTDALVAAAYALICLPLARLPKVPRLAVLLVAHVLLTVLLASGMRVNQLYGQPLNVKMLQYAADGAVRACVGASIDLRLLLSIAVGVAAFFAVGPLSRALSHRLLPSRRWTLWGGAVGLAGFSFVGTVVAFKGMEFNHGLKSNPFVHFAASYHPMPKPADARSELDAARASGQLGRTITYDFSSTRPAPEPTPEISGSARGRNLLVLLLESTGYNALSPELTPNLKRLEAESIRFSHHFTTAPFTFDAQHAIFYSQLIRGSQMSYPELYAGPPKDRSLLEVLQAAGRETAVFNSSYATFLATGWLYEGKGVGTLMTAERLLTGLKPGWAWGAYENDTVDAVLAWLEQHQGKPFALVYNPVSPHHPYTWPRDQRFVPGDSHEDDYRNALHFTDTQIARLIEALERTGLSKNTVVVVVADHGETVPLGHGLNFSADELWAPLFIRVPGQQPFEVSTTTSHLDVAPTLAGLMELPRPETWLGRDFSAGTVESRTSLMTSVFGERVGLVDGDWGWCEEQGKPVAAYKVGDLVFEPVPVSALPQGAAEKYHSQVAALDRRIELRHLDRALAAP
jgi:hypothetical protein